MSIEYALCAVEYARQSASKRGKFLVRQEWIRSPQRQAMETEQNHPIYHPSPKAERLLSSLGKL